MKHIQEEKFHLECECHEMRCFAGFWFQGWEHGEDIPDTPLFSMDFHYHPGSIWKRLKKAWRVIRRNDWHESVDMDICDYRKIEALRDFLNRCLSNEQDPA